MQLDIPTSSYQSFADEYISLFDKNGERPDKGDIGSEYRSLVGLPGGLNSPLYPALKAAADKKQIKLEEGAGSDADTLFKGKIWVMDSNKFPFKQAELYHQFHGFD